MLPVVGLCPARELLRARRQKHALYYRHAAAGLVDNEYAAALKENAAITATRVSNERY